MSNVDRIVELLAEETGKNFDDLTPEQRLYCYAQAMVLDKEGVIVDLKVRKREVIKESE